MKDVTVNTMRSKRKRPSHKSEPRSHNAKKTKSDPSTASDVKEERATLESFHSVYDYLDFTEPKRRPVTVWPAY